MSSHAHHSTPSNPANPTVVDEDRYASPLSNPTPRPALFPSRRSFDHVKKNIPPTYAATVDTFAKLYVIAGPTVRSVCVSLLSPICVTGNGVTRFFVVTVEVLNPSDIRNARSGAM